MTDSDPWVHRTLDEIQAQIDRLWSSAANPSGEPAPGQAAVPYLFVTEDGSVYERTHPDEFDEWDEDDE